MLDLGRARVVSGELISFELAKSKNGELTTRLIRRTFALYLSVFAISLLLLVFSSSSQLHAFALGMMFPGGGLLYLGHYILFPVIVLLFVFTLTGHPVWAPIFWTAMALVAAGSKSEPALEFVQYVLPIACTAMLIHFKIKSEARHRQAQENAEAFNRQLASRSSNVTRSALGSIGGELSLQDRQHAKALLDRALQPIDEFNGFDELEPFGTSALRYQLNFAQYALALLQYSHAPAFKGYLSEAQKNLILKMTDRKAWKYWKLENMWGNFDLNPDPIVRDNIMFSGYLGVMLGTYEAATGDNCFNQPGSLRFTCKSGEEFVYDLPSIAEAINRNFEKAPYTLFPCEPHWVYTMCNPFGLNTLLISDRLNGTALYEGVKDRFEKSLREEFMTADGRFVPIRSSAWGVTPPGLAGTEVNDTFVKFLIHPLYPSLSERSWEAYRYLHYETKESFLHKTETMRMIDPGNYRRNRLAPMAPTALAAKEMGDLEIFNAIMESIDKLHPPERDNGELGYKGVSNWVTFQLAMARFARPGAFYDMIVHGANPELTDGPNLKEAPYPEVFVSKAYVQDERLELLLHADEKPGEYPFKLSNLQPGAAYIVQGSDNKQSVVADPIGESDIRLNVGAGTSISVYKKSTE